MYPHMADGHWAQMMGNWGGGMGGEGWNWLGFGMHGLGAIFFWGLLILVAVLLVRAFGWSGRGGESAKKSPDRSLDILRERFSKGELTEEDYRKMRETLEVE